MTRPIQETQMELLGIPLKEVLKKPGVLTGDIWFRPIGTGPNMAYSVSTSGGYQHFCIHVATGRTVGSWPSAKLAMDTTALWELVSPDALHNLLETPDDE